MGPGQIQVQLSSIFLCKSRHGQTRSDNCWLARPRAGAPRGLWGRREATCHPHRDPTPENRLPLWLPVNSGPSSKERPPPAHPRQTLGSQGLRAGAALTVSSEGASAPLWALQAQFWTEPMSVKLKITLPLCYCTRTLLGLQGRARTQSSGGCFPVPSAQRSHRKC